MAKAPKLPDYPSDRMVTPDVWLIEVVIPNCEDFFADQSFRKIFNACVSCYHFIETLYHYDAWLKMKIRRIEKTLELPDEDMPSEKNFKEKYEPQFLDEDTEFGRSFRVIKNSSNGLKHRFCQRRLGDNVISTTATGIVSSDIDPWIPSLPGSYCLCDQESNMRLDDALWAVLNRWLAECQKRGIDGNEINRKLKSSAYLTLRSNERSEPRVVTYKFLKFPL
ncbi:hypothetical protein [Azospirillum sp. B510]|uniref:hypothetical protein n=1 Tax=Azospirillum sp. (strain B510) TaxID=137722 RepID=UPI0011D0B41A|nr:hypothetical protein [Azospirillum sp. B510]